MGLDNPTAKMSKSEAAENHAVFLLDNLPAARKKIMRAVTDSHREIRFSKDRERAGVNNLLTIYQAITNDASETIEAHFVDRGLRRSQARSSRLRRLRRWNRCKPAMIELMNEAGYLDSVLKLGREEGERYRRGDAKTGARPNGIPGAVLTNGPKFD